MTSCDSETKMGTGVFKKTRVKMVPERAEIALIFLSSKRELGTGGPGPSWYAYTYYIMWAQNPDNIARALVKVWFKDHEPVPNQ